MILMISSDNCRRAPYLLVVSNNSPGEKPKMSPHLTNTLEFQVYASGGVHNDRHFPAHNSGP